MYERSTPSNVNPTRSATRREAALSGSAWISIRSAGRLSKTQRAQHADGPGGHTAPAGLARQPVAELATPLLAVQVDDPHRAEQPVVAGVDQQQAEQLPGASARLCLLQPSPCVGLAVWLRHPGPARDLGVLAGGDDRRDVGVGVQAKPHLPVGDALDRELNVEVNLG